MFRRETRVTEPTVFNFLSLITLYFCSAFGIELCPPSDKLIVCIYIYIYLYYPPYRRMNRASTQLNQTKLTYENALNRSNFNVNLHYTNSSVSDNINLQSVSIKRNRKRNIIWSNPPYSKNVKTNVVRKFLQLIDKHFPKSSRLHTIFNRNNNKVSYSCMRNVKTSISNHNNQVLKQRAEPPTCCNCRSPSECPLNGKCLAESLVYKAEITTTNVKETKIYIGMTSGTFKKRYANHKKSFNNPRYSTETELSKHIWELKNKERDFIIKWSILKRVSPRTAGRSTCNLCIKEKLCILESDSARTLNKISELFSKCCHRYMFSARNFKRSRNSK